eukprot:1261858-Alexandrium_andersonii.AAC.1
MELLALPFELSYALQAGLRAESIVDLGSLEAALWRWRAHRAPPEGVATYFPGLLDGPFLEAVGLRLPVVDLLWGTWTPWGAPQLPDWLMEAWPSAIAGWEAGMAQALRADYMLEVPGCSEGRLGGALGPAELGALTQLARAALLRPVSV